MTVSEFPVPRTDDERLNASLRGVYTGKTNNVLDVTLTANAASTTVTDPRIGPYSAAICIPVTANAAAIAMPYRTSNTNGSMTLAHANDANTDKTFKVVLVG